MAIKVQGVTVIDSANREYVGFREKITSVGPVTTSTKTLDLSLGNIFDVTLNTSSNIAFTFANSGPANVVSYATVFVRQDAVGSRLCNFANSKFTDGVAPVLSTGANNIDILSFLTIDGGSSWFGSFVMANVA